MSDSLPHGEAASDAMLSETQVTFLASIRISKQEIVDADGNVAQAIQNEIGHTGASVIEVISV